MVDLNKAIFLDRDGVINHALVINGKPYAPKNIYDVFFIEGILELVKEWKSMGYLVIVITNQPDIKRKILSKEDSSTINTYIRSFVKYDDIFICPHDELDACECRKPKPGLLLDANNKYGINFKKSYVIGDREKDIMAGKALGCKTIFIDHNYKEKKPTLQDHSIKELWELRRIITE